MSKNHKRKKIKQSLLKKKKPFFQKNRLTDIIFITYDIGN